MGIGRRVQRGQALTEFALLLPFLLVFLFGIVDVGRMVYAYNSVSNAAREAGRTAIVNQTLLTVREKAAQQATGLGLPVGAPSGCPATGGPTTDPSGTCVVLRSATGSGACPTPAVVGCTAIVTVKWEWRAITPIISDILGPINLESMTSQVIEHVCENQPSCPDR